MKKIVLTIFERIMVLNIIISFEKDPILKKIVLDVINAIGFSAEEVVLYQIQYAKDSSSTINWAIDDQDGTQLVAEWEYELHEYILYLLIEYLDDLGKKNEFNENYIGLYDKIDKILN